MKGSRKNPEIHPPENGWRPHVWYLVEVSFGKGNPIHRALFFSGFLNGVENWPGNYSGFHPLNCAHSEYEWYLSDCVYMKVLKPLFDQDGNPVYETAPSQAY